MRPRLAGGEERLRVEREPHHAPVRVADAADDVVVGAAGPQRVDGRELVGRGRRTVLAHGRPAAVAERPADDRVVVEPQDALGAGVARGDPSLGVDQDDALRHRRDDRLIARLAGVQGVVGGRVGDDDPEAVGGGAVRSGKRVVVDAERPPAGGGEHADDRSARLHHAVAEAGRVGREAGEHLGDGRTQELPARAARERGERRVGTGQPQLAVHDSTADRHALENRFEERDGRRCRRRVGMHRLQGVLLARGGQCTGRDASLLAGGRVRPAGAP